MGIRHPERLRTAAETVKEIQKEQVPEKEQEVLTALQAYPAASILPEKLLPQTAVRTADPETHIPEEAYREEGLLREEEQLHREAEAFPHHRAEDSQAAPVDRTFLPEDPAAETAEEAAPEADRLQKEEMVRELQLHLMKVPSAEVLYTFTGG